MEENTQLQTTQKANITITQGGGLVPVDFEGLWRLAVIFSKSGWMPKGMEAPETILVAINMGYEVGLTAMQAVNSIAVINGKPTMWGDAVIGLVQASGKLEAMTEKLENESAKYPDDMAAVCYAKRVGGREVTHRFSVADAKLAKLWGKQGPWSQYSKRMLQMRARGFVLRDLFADVLKGIITREEAMDYDVEMVNVGGEYQAAPEPQQLPTEPTGADYTPQKLDPAPKKEPIQETPVPEKQPEPPAEPTGPAEYSKWINIKKSDYFYDYVQKHHIDFTRSDDENKAAARAKWERMELAGQPKCLGPWPEKVKPAPEAEKLNTESPEYIEYTAACDANPEHAMAARIELFGENREPRHMADLTGLILKIEQLVDGEVS